MKKALVIIIFQFLFTAAFSQDKPAYVLYNAKGEKVSYKQMLANNYNRRRSHNENDFYFNLFDFTI
ncbi:MAG: hypothetical protein HQ554_06545 [FCB group bacterium]|nr:hypothetical protein [Bacteroidota bacterium]MBL7136853.1 hypothetical protein [Candidatus Neomarinimicrobiota bacterium]NQT65821.1 hypothetical protein [FCB group bacterium]